MIYLGLVVSLLKSTFQLRDISLDWFGSYLSDHCLLVSSVLWFFPDFLNQFGDWIGCITKSKSLFPWFQFDTSPNCLFWMTGFVDIMHYSLCLPTILGVVCLQLDVLDYFVLSLLSRLWTDISHGWTGMLFQIMWLVMLSEFINRLGQIHTCCNSSDISMAVAENLSPIPF